MGNTTYPTGIRRDSAGIWYVRATKTCPRTGRLKWRKKKLPASASLADAVRARDALVQGVVAGGIDPLKNETLTVYAHSWLKRRLPHLGSKQSQRRYEEALTLHILPRLSPDEEPLGNLLVSKLRRSDLESWLARCTKLDRHAYQRPAQGRKRDQQPDRPAPIAHKPKFAPYTTQTIDGWWRVLKSMVQSAVAEYGMPIDPTRGIRPLPQNPRLAENSNTLSADELSRLMAYCRVHRPQWYAFLLLGFSIGARPGELRPLRWGKPGIDGDLDPDTGELALQRSQRRDYMGPTKTKVARKTIVAEPVLRALLQHRAYLREQHHPGANSGLVFPGCGSWRPYLPALPWPPGELHYIDAGALDSPLTDMCEKIGIRRRITPRTMRRTFNDLARMAGIDGLITRSLTGHSSDEMRELYSTVSLVERKAASVKILHLVQLPSDGGAKLGAKSNVTEGPHVASSDTAKAS